MSREQKLVDICFELVATVTDHEYSKHFRNMSIDDRMTWVAEQRACRGCDVRQRKRSHSSTARVSVQGTRRT